MQPQPDETRTMLSDRCLQDKNGVDDSKDKLQTVLAQLEKDSFHASCNTTHDRVENSNKDAARGQCASKEQVGYSSSLTKPVKMMRRVACVVQGRKTEDASKACCTGSMDYSSSWR